MKVVLDANIVIAAFATRGLCEALLELCLENHEIVLSEPILLEVGEKLRTKIRLPKATTEEILHFLRNHTSVVEPAEVPARVCRDPDDLLVLGTAKAARASYLVTGDRDLLSLQTFDDIPIVTPREFWESQAKRRR
jgi:putative PIN family toxin of toxin-antitoxin system